MPDEIQQYIEANDNASDYADAQIEGLEQQAREDIDDLYRNPANRDEELWDAFGVDTELTVADYDKEAIRGIDWSLGLAGISAASQTQFFLDNREDTIIRPAAYREQVLAGFTLTRAKLVTAGKRGFEIVGTAQYEAIKAETLKKFAFMKDMTDLELFERLLSNGAIRPAEQTIVWAQGHTARLTGFAPGSPQYKEEIAKLIDTNSKRAMKAMNRRAVSRIHIINQVSGDALTPLVWIVEGGPNTCSYCLDNAGEVDTLDGWTERGLPGADVCLGLDSCRCMLSSW